RLSRAPLRQTRRQTRDRRRPRRRTADFPARRSTLHRTRQTPLRRLPPADRRLLRRSQLRRLHVPPAALRHQPRHHLHRGRTHPAQLAALVALQTLPACLPPATPLAPRPSHRPHLRMNSPDNPPSDWDVIIVGGALSGAATALLLLRRNPRLRVLILERDAAFKRRVGESTVE